MSPCCPQLLWSFDGNTCPLPSPTLSHSSSVYLTLFFGGERWGGCSYLLSCSLYPPYDSWTITCTRIQVIHNRNWVRHCSCCTTCQEAQTAEHQWTTTQSLKWYHPGLWRMWISLARGAEPLLVLIVTHPRATSATCTELHLFTPCDRATLHLCSSCLDTRLFVKMPFAKERLRNEKKMSLFFAVKCDGD